MMNINFEWDEEKAELNIRQSNIRLISARLANIRERRLYYGIV